MFATQSTPARRCRSIRSTRFGDCKARGSGSLREALNMLAAQYPTTFVTAFSLAASLGLAHPAAADWAQTQKIVSTPRGVGAQFGNAVAISGTTMVIGARNDSTTASQAGAAVVYVRSGTNWTQQAKLLANDGALGDKFGYSVAVSDNTIVIGAYNDDGTFAGHRLGLCLYPQRHDLDAATEAHGGRWHCVRRIRQCRRDSGRRHRGWRAFRGPSEQRGLRFGVSLSAKWNGVDVNAEAHSDSRSLPRTCGFRAEALRQLQSDPGRSFR